MAADSVCVDRGGGRIGPSGRRLGCLFRSVQRTRTDGGQKRVERDRSMVELGIDSCLSLSSAASWGELCLPSPCIDRSLEPHSNPPEADPCCKRGSVIYRSCLRLAVSHGKVGRGLLRCRWSGRSALGSAFGRPDATACGCVWDEVVSGGQVHRTRSADSLWRYRQRALLWGHGVLDVASTARGFFEMATPKRAMCGL